MNLVEPIVTIVFGMIAGLLAAYWQNLKLSAETAKIYQGIANQEREEREKLEKKLNQEIKYLSERLAVNHQQLEVLKKEKHDCYTREAELLSKINKLSKEIKQWKKDTGQLK